MKDRNIKGFKLDGGIFASDDLEVAVGAAILAKQEILRAYSENELNDPNAELSPEREMEILASYGGKDFEEPEKEFLTCVKEEYPDIMKIVENGITIYFTPDMEPYLN